jgi:hypothetical protein
MVSPADGWEETENGYLADGGDTRVYVENDKDANGWNLQLAYQDHEQQKMLTRFKDVRTAWKFANLLTYHISFIGSSGAMGDFDPDTGGGLPDVVEEGCDGEEIYRDALGDREYMLDNALEESN